MSQKFPGGFITKSPVAPTTTAASGVWTLDQQQQYQKAGTWPSPPIFIEDLFSTYLYTGNGSTQTITNGIDVSGKGGLVWAKSRSNVIRNSLFDTARGANYQLSTNNTEASADVAPNGISFTSTGFTTGSFVNTNTNAATYVSWTFAKQPKFFDIVTWTGDSTAGRTVAHNLGSVPGCIIVKCTSQAVGGGWPVYHRSLGNTQTAVLNTTDAAFTYGYWNNTTPTSTVFTLNGDSDVNGTGKTYIAYLFAHDAGGFPVSGGGSTNGISCGSYTAAAAGSIIDLGYEPQWIMIKKSSDLESWYIYDAMRGVVTGGGNSQDQKLRANTESAESAVAAPIIAFTANGFQLESTDNEINGAGGTYIYIAIRRGPMKVPTSGTSVFKPLYEAGTGSARTVNAGFPTDLFFIKDSTGLTGPTAGGNVFYDRLRGNSNVLQTQSTAAEAVSGTYTALFNSVQNGVVVSDYWSSYAYREYCFQRAPSFFDEVCYTGTGSATTQTHNLGVVPELIIVKVRNDAESWQVYSAETGNTKCISLNNSNAAVVLNNWNNTTPTASVFSLGVFNAVNGSGLNYVAYLFATLAGVSKVGSYTGTGALQTVNCGFTSGARFVLIKRTDSTGDWYTYDSARGITSSNDPYLLLNSTAAEVTGTNYVDTDTTGFQVTAAAPAGLNANGGTYIFLAIA